MLTKHNNLTAKYLIKKRYVFAYWLKQTNSSLKINEVTFAEFIGLSGAALTKITFHFDPLNLDPAPFDNSVILKITLPA